MTTFWSLSKFNKTLDGAVGGLIETRLVQEKNRVKVHWAIPDVANDMMLGVTPEEGEILFAIARILKPEKIVELGTGTGVSTVYLAAGWPGAKVVTIDNFKMGSDAELVKRLWDRLGFTHRIKLYEQDLLSVNPEELSAPLMFMDGSIKHQAYEVFNHLPKDAIIIEHDTGTMDPKPMAHQILTLSPSHISLHGNDIAKLEYLHDIASIFCNY